MECNHKNNKDKKRLDAYILNTIKCHNCGHSIFFPVYIDKQICSWCHCLVYRNDKIKFRETLLKTIRRKENNDG